MKHISENFKIPFGLSFGKMYKLTSNLNCNEKFLTRLFSFKN